MLRISTGFLSFPLFRWFFSLSLSLEEFYLKKSVECRGEHSSRIRFYSPEREDCCFASDRETIDVNSHLHNRGCLDRLDGNVSSNQWSPCRVVSLRFLFSFLSGEFEMTRRLLCLFSLLIGVSGAQHADVIGCGGFIKSETDINYKVVRVSSETEREEHHPEFVL